MITQERLKEVLHYNPETGIFVWEHSTPYVSAGTTAGWIDNGYIRIYVDGKEYKAHRLAFLYMEGYFPYNFPNCNSTSSSYEYLKDNDLL